MSIIYKGDGKLLTTVPQVIAEAVTGTKSTNAVHIQITNADALYRRTLVMWMQIIGGRNQMIAEALEIEYGAAPQFSGVTLNPGEKIQAWAETNGLLSATISTGEQR